MEKHPFTVIAARPAVADAWLNGILNDFILIQENGGPVPCPCVLVVLRVEGQAAGMRALFAFLAGLIGQGIKPAGFGMRTRLASVARVFERFGGWVTFDEGDGDRRWYAPAEPGLSWLTQRSVKES
jgi:hypothetical protein